MGRPAPSVSGEQLADRVAAAIARRGLKVPAMWFLQTFKPLSFVGSQVLLVLQPLADIWGNEGSLGSYARLLEDADGIEMILRRLEQMA